MNACMDTVVDVVIAGMCRICLGDVYVYFEVGMFMCMYVCMYVSMYVCMCVCLCVYVYRYVFM
jgi:hypothetical protein